MRLRGGENSEIVEANPWLVIARFVTGLCTPPWASAPKQKPRGKDLVTRLMEKGLIPLAADLAS